MSVCREPIPVLMKGIDGLYWQHDSCIFMDTDNEELLFKVISTSWH